MVRAAKKDQVYTADYIEQNFDRLREAALQNLTSYVCGWSTYSIEFLNAVAEMQGHPRRLSIDTIVALRKGPKRIRDPRLAKLFRESRCARTMKIREIVELIEAKVADRNEPTR